MFKVECNISSDLGKLLCFYLVHIATISILNYVVGHSFVSYSIKKQVSVTKLLDKI